MPLVPSWQDIALRLFCTVLTCGVIGLNRGERGRPAGLRTTVLVGLAAALAMIEANLLLNVSGKTPSSFVVLDLMRFPLGILSGIGFIGAGAILRRGDRINGVTTAATIWFVTMMGLCFGGGQIGLGLAGFALACAILWGLKLVEEKIPQERKASLLIEAEESLDPRVIRQLVTARGFAIVACSIERRRDCFELGCVVRWSVLLSDTDLPRFLSELSQLKEVRRIRWLPQGSPQELGLQTEES